MSILEKRNLDLRQHNTHLSGNGTLSISHKKTQSFLSGYPDDAGQLKIQSIEKALTNYDKIDSTNAQKIAQILSARYTVDMSDEDLISLVKENSIYGKLGANLQIDSWKFKELKNALKSNLVSIPAVLITPIESGGDGGSYVASDMDVDKLERSLATLKQKAIDSEKKIIRANLQSSITETAAAEVGVKNYVNRLNSVKAQLMPLIDNPDASIKKEATQLMALADKYLSSFSDALVQLASDKKELEVKLANV